MSKPTTLTATYRIVTPMFIGDGNQQATSIRPPSVKGALRFWWRALQWGRIRNQYSCDELALQELHRREAELFGAAGNEEGTHGQAKFLLKLTDCRVTDLTPEKLLINYPLSSGHKYLLGQGLFAIGSKKKNTVDRYLRSAIQANSDFSITCHARDPSILNEIKDALWLLGLVGNLGARSRHGFGSMSLTSLDDVTLPTNVQEYKTQLTQLIGLPCLYAENPPFTSFSTNMRIEASVIGDSAWNLLNIVGDEAQLFRSYGRANPRTLMHEVNGKKAEQNFPNDHHLLDNLTNGATHKLPANFYHPERVVFGLPHNYFFSSTFRQAEVKPVHKTPKGWLSEGRSRRASPLFLHIHRFSDKEYAAIHLFMPATFLPCNEKIRIEAGNKKVDVNISVDWKPIHDFLNRFPKPHEGKIYP
jgi:CRISPR-associated protein Cmr1